MAKPMDVKLDGQPNWQAVAEELFKLLAVETPEHLSADDRKALISSLSPKSKVTVNIDTVMDYGQLLDLPLAERRARKEVKKGEEFDYGWFIVQYFCHGWKGLKHAETGEELPFSQDAMRHARATEIAEIIELATNVAQGRAPNA